MSRFDTALEVVPESLRASVRVHWQNFSESARNSDIRLLDDSEVLQQLVRTWACSEYVAHVCTRYPDILTDLLKSGDLRTTYTPNRFVNALSSLLTEDLSDEVKLACVLRRFRHREMVRIAWRDLSGLASLQETLLDLSNLADSVTDAALDLLYDWHCQRFGVPRDRQGNPQRLIVLGMGKLGGQELNFSSDIDLIFTFPANGETDVRAIENQEFFRRLCQRLIKALNEITTDGFVFRVDTRLRPFGDSGPLVMNFNALEEYYQNHGRDWERYALIKARAIAGDKAAGEQILELLRPFIYRRYLDYGAFDALRSMKALIAKEVERKGLRRNVKLGPGGIREIEFIGQAFQLIYGGREPALRERRILPVLKHLAETKRLPHHAVDHLIKAYVFLRRTENRIQAWSDQQEHNLPQDDIAKQRLAFSMETNDWSAFTSLLTHHAQEVSKQFDQVFAIPAATTEEDTDEPDFDAVWNATLNPQSTLKLLADSGFDDADKALEILQYLRNSFANRSLGKRGRERMDQLLPVLLKAISTTDSTIGSTTNSPIITLERIVHLLEAIARRSVYLALLVESPVALAQLVKLCAASVWIARYLARYPLLLDDLLDPERLYSPLDRSHLASELEHAIARAGDDEEQRIDSLRHFKHTNVLRVAAADISGAVPIMKVSDYLTDIAEIILQTTLRLAWEDLIPRFGQPRCIVNGKPHEPGFAIIAYGKLGGIELGYGSDLDLVFLHDSAGEQQQTDGLRVIDNSSFFAKLAQRLIHMLTAHTAAGVLYAVDTRLRPSGRSGLLVSSFDAYTEYQRNQAWTWEHQALVRARVVGGPASLDRRFTDLRHEMLTQRRDPDHLRQEVRDMRERMRTELDKSKAGLFDLKQGRGGITDIEFIVQFSILSNAHRYPELLTFTDNIRQLDGLEQVSVLNSNDASILRDCYRALRRHLHLRKLQEQPDVTSDEELADYRQAVTRIWQSLFENS